MIDILKKESMQDLVAKTIEDGVVDAEEVKALKEAFYADGVIDKQEADDTFQINDAVSGNDNDPSWDDLFVEVLSDFVLKDEETPGVIDAEEGKYLAEKIEGDGNLDDVEKKLLANLKEKATEIQSPELNTLISTLS